MAATGESLRINGARLRDSLTEMAKIGPGVTDGNNRLPSPMRTAQAATCFKTGAKMRAAEWAWTGRAICLSNALPGPGYAASLCALAS